MKKIFLVIALFALTLGSCVKMPKSDPNIPGLEFKIPDNFDWKTTKEIKVQVGVTAVDAVSKEKLHVIKIYNSPLLNSGALIASGIATPNKPFNVSLSVASITDTLYIYELKPNGLTAVTNQAISTPSLNVKLINDPLEMLTKSNTSIASNVAPPTLPAMPFPTGLNYDEIITENSEVNLLGFNTSETSAYGNTYKSYYIPAGVTRTKIISFNNYRATHAILYVKGTLILNDINSQKCSIVILDGGVVTFNQLSNSLSAPLPFIYIQNGGKLNIINSLTLNNDASLINKGTLSAKKISLSGTNTVLNEGTLSVTNSDFELNSSIFYNSGTINVSKIFKLNGNTSATNDRGVITTENFSLTSTSVLYNSGTINVTKKIDLTYRASLTNDGGIITAKEIYFSDNTIINNHGEVVATEKFHNSGGGTVNNFCRITAQETNASALTANLMEGSLWHTQKFLAHTSRFNMAGGSMLLAADVPVQPYKMTFISTSSSFALLKITGNVPDLRSGSVSEISGNIEFVHTNLTIGSGANGNLLYLSTLKNGAIVSKEQTKNIPGTACNLSLGQIDPGTPPIDPNAEYSSYFPSEGTWGTYAFEDQWPAKGDYDLNDLVLAFRITYITNNSNQITKLHFDYDLVAAGAMKQIGAGFQLDNVMASNIKSVTGQVLGGDSPFSIGSNGAEAGVTKAIIPIFNNTKEVVSYSGFLNTVPGELTATTAKKISIEFNTPIDRSNITEASFNFFIVPDSRGKEIHVPGYSPTEKFNNSFAAGGSLHPSDIYKHSDGMMWGLMFPDSFSYPSEKNSIIDAYNHFTTWATSGGAQYADWYSNKPGYRNVQLIY